jgi:hypothetical protein
MAGYYPAANDSSKPHGSKNQGGAGRQKDTQFGDL